MKYHLGEIQAQTKAGVSAQASRLRGMLRSEIPYGAHPFLENIETLVMTLLDSSGWPYMIWLYGRPGVVKVLGPRQILLDREKLLLGWDQLEEGISAEIQELGLLFMDFETRRRFRINGTAQYVDEGILISSQQAYGNCPKYIQKRFFEAPQIREISPQKISAGKQLQDMQITRIRESDTFFVGSRNSLGKVDSSHRGGNPGFIEIIAPELLKIPDYSGNNMFNTLGNFIEDSRATLLFPDFQSGSELHLKGRVSIDWEQQTLDQAIQRYWTFAVSDWKEIRRRYPMQAYHLEYSPFNPLGGDGKRFQTEKRRKKF